jgi:predicted small lipoprotein YifL
MDQNAGKGRRDQLSVGQSIAALRQRIRIVTRSLASIILVGVLASALTGCGVRGSLDAPSAAGGEPQKTNTATADSGQGKKEGEAPKPHQGFILDGLLR